MNPIVLHRALSRSFFFSRVIRDAKIKNFHQFAFQIEGKPVNPDSVADCLEDTKGFMFLMKDADVENLYVATYIEQ